MTLTPPQKLAAESTDKPTAIIAGAGSGKTDVLKERVLCLLNIEKIPLNQILCITFTEKTAQQFKERVAKSLPEKFKKELPWAPISTFHGFCLNLLREQAPLLGLPEGFSVWDEHTAKLAIHKACRSTLLEGLDTKNADALLLTEALEFRYALELLEELMQFRWHAEKIFEKKDSTQQQELYLIQAAERLYAQVRTNYDADKGLHQVLDFQDLEIMALKLLKENSVVRKACQKKFRHILVDEVQDINDLQLELLEQLFEPGKNILCAVGDPKQSIYRFRGANVEGFNRLIKQIVSHGGHAVELKENFRSRPALLRFVNHTFKDLFSPNDDFELKPTREELPKPCITLLPIVSAEEKIDKEESRRLEAFLIARYILSLDCPLKDVALLFQSLTDSAIYEQAFKDHNIPYRISGGRGFLHAQEVIDCLFCLKLMTDMNDRLALVGILRSPLVGLTDARITALCLAHPQNLGEAVLELPEALWLKEIWLSKEKLSAAEILELSVAKTHYDCLLKALDPSDTQVANVERLIELTRQLEIEEELSRGELLEYFEALKKRQAPLAQAQSVEDVEGACQMMTVHASKGLQFPVVILPDLLRGAPSDTLRYLFLRGEGLAFSLKENPKDVYSEVFKSAKLKILKEKEDLQNFNERKRLLYVALTRAREKIVLPWQEGASRTGVWYKWIEAALKDCGEVTRWNPETDAAPSQGDGDSIIGSLPVIEVKEKRAEGTPYYTVTELERAQQQTSKDKRQTSNAAHRGLKGTDLGNWVHAVLKEMRPDNPVPLETIARTRLLELSIAAGQEDFEEGVKLIRRFLETNDLPKDWKGFHELPFQLKSDGAVVTGVIDYCWKTDAGWIIADFKTDAKADAEKYAFQMDTYALALSQGQSKPVLETRLLFLKSGKIVPQACTPERLKKADEELHRRIQSFRMGKYAG